MIPFHSDLLHLKWSLSAFIGSAAIGASAIVLAAGYESSSFHTLKNLQNQVSEARSQLSNSRDDLENMSAYALEYASLVDHKIVAGEQRLDWMEELEKLRRQQHVIAFRYTISPQQHYISPLELETGNFEIKLSGVSLQVDLLHEMQLIGLLEALRADIKGRFIIENCSMERLVANVGELESLPNFGTQLKAECTGGWITLTHRNFR